MNIKNPAVLPISLGRSTAYLIRGKNGHILVDSGPPGSGKKLLKKLSQEGISPEQISLVVLTHAHLDHSGALEDILKAGGAKLAVHKDEAPALEQEEELHLNPVRPLGRLVKAFIGKKRKKGSSEIKPDLVINKELDLKPFGIKGKVVATPGHTPGSVTVFLQTGEAIVGDLLMGGMLFRRRRPFYPLFASDVKQLERSIRLVLKLKPKLILPAHGGPFTPAQVETKLLQPRRIKRKKARRG
ncbi:MAG TPA: MBL fold metallo-hydrolase [Bacillota bacterium]|nr:MBL fold metallo-hydrolase [Bacillota bacterium]HOB87015.1 MBL fold metallo-hydrolase [Bacillota bacterium]HOP69279.1 MBL fold metallo-hydrolase [Bacillota bacterium]HPT34271.1 MBL fold metallo-hydrolase [Bacillota bacterium]HQD05420.1 MBL fold metallo-hydrolase [Bacillota bacterium]